MLMVEDYLEHSSLAIIEDIFIILLIFKKSFHSLISGCLAPARLIKLRDRSFLHWSFLQRLYQICNSIFIDDGFSENDIFLCFLYFLTLCPAEPWPIVFYFAL